MIPAMAIWFYFRELLLSETKSQPPGDRVTEYIAFHDKLFDVRVHHRGTLSSYRILDCGTRVPKRYEFRPCTRFCKRFSVNVCFAPNATEVLPCRELT